MLKSETSIKRRRKAKVKVATRVQTSRKPVDVKAVEIEVFIVDKIISNALVDGGSSLNIMPLQTMEKLGLEFTGPSPFVINMANQRPEAPLGLIKDCKVSTGGEEYLLTFHVIRMYLNKDSFPFLLGRPWLTTASAKVDWGGNKPHILYGPSDNLTKVRIQSIKISDDSEPSQSSGDETPIPVTTPNIQRQAQMEKPWTGSEPQLLDTTHHVLGCIGPGLYDWKDDGQFAQWLEDNPHSDLEHTTCYIEASMRELEDGYPGLATVIDDIIYEDVYHLTMDGTQFEGIL